MKKRFLLPVICLGLVALYSCNDDYIDNSVTIVFTNDTHGQINKKLSFANAGAMKQDLINKGKNALLLDSGDIISGGFYTTYDKGQSMVHFMEEAGYDAATLGNHEFDYKFDYLDQIVKNSKFPFISTNLYHMKDNVPTTRYTDLGSKTFTFKNNVKVGVIGVSTPESITSSTPTYFQDDKGNYIYTFLDKNNELYNVVQDEINILKNEEHCSFVVCLSHLGDENQNNAFTASKLAKNTYGIDAILDGHTHIPDKGHTVKDKNNNDVFIAQAGGTFSNIGKLKLSKLEKPKCELFSNTDLVNETLKNKEIKYVNDVDESLSTKVATSNLDFVRNSFKESNIGDLISESIYYYYNNYLKEKGEDCPCDLSLVNVGGIRSNVKSGDWTKKTCREVLSFGNGVCEISVKGSILRNALEFSYYLVDLEGSEASYFGGLEQICGAKVTIDTNVKSDIKVDGQGNYESGPSEDHRRLTSIEIYDKDSKSYLSLDDDKEYIIGGSSYILLNGGNGFTMFKDSVLIRQEGTYVDSDVLELYVSNFEKGESELPVISAANSPLKYDGLLINYDEPFGGRINLI